MKRTFLALLLCIMMSSSALAFTPMDDADIQHINDVRGYNDGFSSLEINEALLSAAKNHSTYLHTYEKNTKEKVYTQEKDKPIFSGLYPWDRVAYFNYDVTKNPYTNELIYLSKESPQDIFSQMIDDPYYRVELFNPNYQHIGYYQESNKFVVELGGKKSNTKDVIYPFDTQQWVPYQWVDGNNVTTGYPITYSIYATADIKRMSLLQGSIRERGKDGKEIAYSVKTPENDESLTNTIIITPEEPLKPNTEYEVSLTANIVYKVGSSTSKLKKWTFKTGGRTSTYFYINKRDKIRREEFARQLIDRAGIPTMKIKESTYTDVSPNSVYYEEIMTLKELGIMQGYTDEIFGYGQYLTREQAFVLVMRLYNYLLDTDYAAYELYEVPKFTDINDVSQWAIDAINVGYNLDIVSGYENNTLQPKNKINFSEAQWIVERVTKYNK